MTLINRIYFIYVLRIYLFTLVKKRFPLYIHKSKNQYFYNIPKTKIQKKTGINGKEGKGWNAEGTRTNEGGRECERL